MLSNILARNLHFEYTFNSTPKVEISGRTENYPYEGFLKIDFGILDNKRQQTNLVTSRTGEPPCWYGTQMFSFYVPWVIQVTTWDSEDGFQVLSYHQYNDFNRDVQIKLYTDDWEQMCTWIKVCFEYRNLHRCHLNFAVNNKDLQRRATKDFGISFLDMEDEMFGVYKTYNIGRFEQPEDAGQFINILDENQKETQIPNPYPESLPAGKRYVETNMLYSLKNPRDPFELNDEDVAKDILGLSDLEMFR